MSLRTQFSYYHMVNLRDLFPLGSTDIRKDCLKFCFAYRDASSNAYPR
jgi:hypothetical protein